MKMLLMGYYGSRNLGDEMMFYCLSQWLRAQGIDITLLCENSENTSSRLKVPAVENVPLLFEWAWRDVWLRGKAFRLIKNLRQSAGLIVGGGDLLRDDRGWRVFMYPMEKILLALMLRKPVMLLNVGLGKPITWYGRVLLFWSLRKCRQVVVRDLRSMEVCREAGVDAVLLPDIVTHLPVWLMSWKNKSAAAHSPYVVVCLRATSNAFGQYSLDETRLDNLAGALSDVAIRNGLKIVFLPFQSAVSENADDNEIHRKIAKRMDPRVVAEIREWTHDVREIVCCIGGASCVLAMRLHAAILAVACERACIVMPYDYKVSEAARMFDIRSQITVGLLKDRSAVMECLENALKSGAADPEALLWRKNSWNSLSFRPA